MFCGFVWLESAEGNFAVLCPLAEGIICLHLQVVKEGEVFGTKLGIRQRNTLKQKRNLTKLLAPDCHEGVFVYLLF